MGIDTGVDLDKLVDCSEFISGAIGRSIGSRVSTALLTKKRKNAQAKTCV